MKFDISERRLIVSNKGFIHFIPWDEIIFCQSYSGYTKVLMKSGAELISCKSLKRTYSELCSKTFLKVSQSTIVNVIHVRSIDKTNRKINLIDGHNVDVRLKLGELLKNLNLQEDVPTVDEKNI